MRTKCRVTHKTGYSDEQDARRGMMHIWSHDPSADMRDLHVYICPFCKRWHIGHQSKYNKSKEQEAYYDEQTGD